MGVVHRVFVGCPAGRSICFGALPLVAFSLLAAPSPPSPPGVPAVKIQASAPANPGPPTAHSLAAGVREVLVRQQAAWNRGDVDEFLAGYWNSDRTVFAGSNGILHGWQALRQRYRRSYPDRRAMGRLTFSHLEITSLCTSSALVLGEWHLDRESGPVGGVFSLVLRRLPEGWRIVADHTSVVAEPAHAPAR